MSRHLTVKLAPSILSADAARLGEQVAEVERAGADRIHVDVMDGHFVPNITFGPVVVRWLRPVTRLPLEVHLMIEDPDRFLDAFAEAGADTLIVHQEGAIHLNRTVQQIKALGKRAGVAINPATPAAMLEEILPDLDLVLVMTVNPGFGGQSFLPGTLAKIRTVRQMIDAIRPGCELEVDGGIDHETAPLVVEAGATVLVAGSSIYRCTRRRGCRDEADPRGALICRQGFMEFSDPRPFASGQGQKGCFPRHPHKISKKILDFRWTEEVTIISLIPYYRANSCPMAFSFLHNQVVRRSFALGEARESSSRVLPCLPIVSRVEEPRPLVPINWSA